MHAMLFIKGPLFLFRVKAKIALLGLLTNGAVKLPITRICCKTAPPFIDQSFVVIVCRHITFALGYRKMHTKIKQ